MGDRTIVTNGDQTDTILRFPGHRAGTFADALRTREFEPDAPNCTPRISCLMKGNGAHKMSILKPAMAKPASASSLSTRRFGAWAITCTPIAG